MIKHIANRLGSRKIDGGYIPLGSELGRILIKSRDSHQIVEAIRNNDRSTIELSEETKLKLSSAEDKTKSE